MRVSKSRACKLSMPSFLKRSSSGDSCSRGTWKWLAANRKTSSVTSRRDCMYLYFSDISRKTIFAATMTNPIARFFLLQILIDPAHPSRHHIRRAHGIAGKMSANRIGEELCSHAIVLERVIHLIRLYNGDTEVSRVAKNQRRRFDLRCVGDRRLLAVNFPVVTDPR